ncbi:hypothetical protein Y1Q_0023882 [Alligator mississippiensis]|uniref:Uncharacterized protein n=1 Tax=Alligator mississippiensis TaxID=8496 RepID=A0A151MKJ8_ALLMI|nr:hypothetical protein Y1Q_0023882 [Alligator mississippiensis]
MYEGHVSRAKGETVIKDLERRERTRSPSLLLKDQAKTEGFEKEGSNLSQNQHYRGFNTQKDIWKNQVFNSSCLRED